MKINFKELIASEWMSATLSSFIATVLGIIVTIGVAQYEDYKTNQEAKRQNILGALADIENGLSLMSTDSADIANCYNILIPAYEKYTKGESLTAEEMTFFFYSLPLTELSSFSPFVSEKMLDDFSMSSKADIQLMRKIHMSNEVWRKYVAERTKLKELLSQAKAEIASISYTKEDFDEQKVIRQLMESRAFQCLAQRLNFLFYEQMQNSGKDFFANQMEEMEWHRQLIIRLANISKEDISSFLEWQRKTVNDIVDDLERENVAARPRITFSTTMGDITIALYNESPKHRDNFLEQAKSGYYDSLLFHRVIPNYIVQTGDATSKYAKAGELIADESPEPTIEAEIIFPAQQHTRGMVAAAREPDDVNPEFRSSSHQFYIVLGRTYDNDSTLEADCRKMMERSRRPVDQLSYQIYKTNPCLPELDGTYTIFGEVEEGMDVIMAMQKVKCDKNNRPVKDIRILKTSIKLPEQK